MAVKRMDNVGIVVVDIAPDGLFAVEAIDDVVARRRARGAELVGEPVQYENSCRLCHVRGPEGILAALAEKIG